MATILVIDDEGDIRDVLSAVFRKEGHNIELAANGAEGMQLCRQQPVELLITDIVMPGINGVDVIKELRSEFPKLAIIAISGGGNFGPMSFKPDAINTTAYLAAAESAGANRILTKPFERKEMVQAVNDLLQK